MPYFKKVTRIKEVIHADGSSTKTILVTEEPVGAGGGCFHSDCVACSQVGFSVFDLPIRMTRDYISQRRE